VVSSAATGAARAGQARPQSTRTQHAGRFMPNATGQSGRALGALARARYSVRGRPP
jgi:hypothetical protein